jgi:hypothetical protein
MNSIKSAESPIEIKYTEIEGSSSGDKQLFYLDQNGVKLPVSSSEVYNYALKNDFKFVE